MLLPVLVDTEPLKVDIPAGAELRLHGARDVDWALHAQLRQPVLEHLEVDGDDARHLDGAAEADLAVSLAEVQVTHAELGAVDVHGEVHLAAACFACVSLSISQIQSSKKPVHTRKVLDIAIAPMLRPPRHSPRALAANLLGERHIARGDAARMAVVRQGGQRDVAAVLELRVGDELPLALVPRRQDLGRGRAAQDPRVDEPRELHVRDVPRGAVDALEVPDCFCARWWC